MLLVLLVTTSLLFFHFNVVVDSQVIPSEFEATKTFQINPSVGVGPEDLSAVYNVPQSSRPVIIGVPDQMVGNPESPIWLLPNNDRYMGMRTIEPRSNTNSDRARSTPGKFCLWGLCIGNDDTNTASTSAQSNDDSDGGGSSDENQFYVMKQSKEPTRRRKSKNGRKRREHPDNCNIHEVTAYCGSRCWSKLISKRITKKYTAECLRSCVSVLRDNCDERSSRAAEFSGRGLIGKSKGEALNQANMLEAKIHGRAW